MKMPCFDETDETIEKHWLQGSNSLLGPFKVIRKFEQLHTYAGKEFRFHIKETKIGVPTNELDDEFDISLWESGRGYVTRQELKELADLIYFVIDRDPTPPVHPHAWGIKD